MMDMDQDALAPVPPRNVGLPPELDARIRAGIEEATAFAGTGAGPGDVMDSRCEGYMALSIWSGGNVPEGVFALQFLASPEISPSGLAPYLRQLADMFERDGS